MQGLAMICKELRFAFGLETDNKQLYAGNSLNYDSSIKYYNWSLQFCHFFDKFY